jgi:3-keto-L-gulonate-6-phosphate decarboxylase
METVTVVAAAAEPVVEQAATIAPEPRVEIQVDL